MERESNSQLIHDFIPLEGLAGSCIFGIPLPLPPLLMLVVQSIREQFGEGLYSLNSIIGRYTLIKY